MTPFHDQLTVKDTEVTIVEQALGIWFLKSERLSRPVIFLCVCVCVCVCVCLCLCVSYFPNKKLGTATRHETNRRRGSLGVSRAFPTWPPLPRCRGLWDSSQKLEHDLPTSDLHELLHFIDEEAKVQKVYWSLHRLVVGYDYNADLLTSGPGPFPL